MSLRRRVGLAVLGLALVAFAAVALAYAFTADPVTREQYRPAPTLFAPP